MRLRAARASGAVCADVLESRSVAQRPRTALERSRRSSAWSALRLVAGRRARAARRPRATPRGARVEEAAAARRASARRARASTAPNTGAWWPRSAPRAARGRDRAPSGQIARAGRAASARPCARLARLATALVRNASQRASSSARRVGIVVRGRTKRQRAAAGLPERVVDEPRAARSASRTSPELPRRLEPAGVREAAGRERPSRRAAGGARSASSWPQNSEVALRERQTSPRARSVRSSPSARTSYVSGST